MAKDFEIIREIPPAELNQPELDPIARILKTIPGIGEFLSGVQKQTSPKGFYGPGIISQILGKATGATSQQVYDKTIGPTETAASLAGTMAFPMGSIPKRVGQATLQPMLEHLLAGNVDSPGTGLIKGGIGGALQGLVAEPVAGIVKQGGMRKAAKAADVAYEKAFGSHADQAAKSIMDDAKAMIPWWKDLPSSINGLISGVTGKGPRLLRQGYAKAFEGVLENATNANGRPKTIDLPLEDIKKLGVGLVSNISTPGQGDVMLGTAKATEVAEKILGLWDKNPGLFHRAATALDAAGIGNPEARAAYKFGQGIIEYVDATKAIEGGVVHTDRLVKGMDSVKKMRILDRRNMGNSEEGLFQAARGAPADPRLPQQGMPPVIQAHPLGSVGQQTQAGAAVGSAAGGITGTGMGGYGPLALVGRTLAAIAPEEWVTKAPGTEPLIDLIGQLTQGAGTGVRLGATAAGESLGFLPSNIPQGDPAEMEAAIAARQRAVEDDTGPATNDDGGLSQLLEAARAQSGPLNP